MSKIGKQILEIPAGTEVTMSGSVLTVKGPKGSLSKTFLTDKIKVVIEGNTVKFELVKDDMFSRSLWGTYASHVSNMIAGVNTGYEKKLVIEGVGYKAEVAGKELVLSLGFSHLVKVPIPETLKVVAEKTAITISGIDKEEVGQFAAHIRSLKKPEPYKGKGIAYQGEVIRRKQGKKTA